jgi:hypothetical protein
MRGHPRRPRLERVLQESGGLRQAIAASVDLATVEPHPGLDWDTAFARFTALVQASQVDHCYRF